MDAYLKKIEDKVSSAIKKYELCDKNEKIAVAVSGGKDSTTLIYILKKLGYNVHALFIDLGIKGNSDENLARIESFCKENSIPLNIFSLKKETGFSLPVICEKVKKKQDSTNCAICGVIKRYYLNKISREMGATKIATGHNLDDEAENVMLNIFSNNFDISIGLGPKSSESSGLFVQRIKPLYLCLNSETKKYSEIIGLDIFPEICPLRTDAFRLEVRKFLKMLDSISKDSKINIVNNFNKKMAGFRNTEKSNLLKCKKCGEPSRNELCKNCEILNIANLKR